MSTQIFQKYHSKENVVTANLIFFLERIKHISIGTYYTFIEELFTDNLDVGGLRETTKLQEGENKKKGASIPDATIIQPSYKIVIETKLNNAFYKKQLRGHLSSFSNEDYQLLLTVDPTFFPTDLKNDIKNDIDVFNKKNSTNIIHIHMTFKSIIESLEDIIPQFNFALKDLISDYKRYCIEEGLIANLESLMRVPTVGTTFQFNLENNIYYKGYMGYRDVSYIGLYTNKSIRGIGKISAIIDAEFDRDEDLKVIRYYSPQKGELKHMITDDERKKIEYSFENAKEYGWDLTKPHTYYIVEKFVECDFPKVSKGGLQGFRYIDLQEINGISDVKKLSINDIVEILNKSEWK